MQRIREPRGGGGTASSAPTNTTVGTSTSPNPVKASIRPVVSNRPRPSTSQMIARRSGKIVAFTSAVAVRAIPGLAVYSAARGAQNAFVLATGAEVAPHNIPFNAIARPTWRATS
jgi:NAD(P)-dependent dehydrogenase (short-subunit alcohol dehydrogenase family)